MTPQLDPDLGPRGERILTVSRAIVHEIRTEKITFLAGSIAYHAFVSLLPLLLLVLAVLSAVGDAGLERSFLRLTEAVLTPGGSRVLVEELQGAGTSVSLFGLAVLVWGTLRIFRGLDTAFSDIYESETENTFLDQLGDGILVLVTFGVALVAAALLQTLLPLSGVGVGAWLLRRLVLIGVLAVLLYPMYYVFPDSGVGPVEVVPGTLLAAVALTVFGTLFGLFAGGGDSPNAVAGVLVLLTWLYFSGLFVLLGAVVNAVLSNRSRDVNLEPVLGGVAPRPEPAPSSPSRTEVVAALERLDALLRASADGREDGDGDGAGAAEADTVTVAVGGEAVALPPPDRVETDTTPSGFLSGGDVGVSLRWSPRGDGSEG
jgi:membrane protein